MIWLVLGGAIASVLAMAFVAARLGGASDKEREVLREDQHKTLAAAKAREDQRRRNLSVPPDGVPDDGFRRD